MYAMYITRSKQETFAKMQHIILILLLLLVDCWDGPNDEPLIYHGRTLTSKILFKDVIAAINEYGFEMSE